MQPLAVETSQSPPLLKGTVASHGPRMPGDPPQNHPPHRAPPQCPLFPPPGVGVHIRGCPEAHMVVRTWGGQWEELPASRGVLGPLRCTGRPHPGGRPAPGSTAVATACLLGRARRLRFSAARAPSGTESGAQPAGGALWASLLAPGACVLVCPRRFHVPPCGAVSPPPSWCPFGSIPARKRSPHPPAPGLDSLRGLKP